MPAIDVGCCRVSSMDMPILDTRKYKDGIEQLVSDIVLQLLSYFAEQDRLTIKRQQADGIAAVKKHGISGLYQVVVQN